MITNEQADAIRADIAHTADALGIPVLKLSRAKYIAHGQFGWKWESLGPWSVVRFDVARAHDGGPGPFELKHTEGARSRNAAARRDDRARGRELYFAERYERALADAFERSPFVLPKRRKFAHARRAPGDRVVNAFLSDLHFGSIVDPREVLGCEFNIRIAARRIAYFATHIAKAANGEATHLNLLFGGDILQNQTLHPDDSACMALADEKHAGLWILGQLLDYLRDHFATIRCPMVPGNHDRFTSKNPTRALAQRFNNHAADIYRALEFAFRDDDSIVFDRPRSGIATFPLPGGAMGMLTHGDTAPNAPNVYRSIDPKRIEAQINELIASGVFEQAPDVVCYGHLHKPCTIPAGRSDVVINGDLRGGDGYAQNGIGVHRPRPCQVMWESAPGFPCGAFTRIYLEAADDRADLDAIVSPPEI